MTLEQSNIVCPTCGSSDHMHHLVGANVGYWDMKCFNCNSYFNFDELYKHRIAGVIKPMTNADRIRAMTNEELAKELWAWNQTCCYKWKKEKVLKWLKQEREE